jgi:diacylglycerol kinase family enzyme
MRDRAPLAVVIYNPVAGGSRGEIASLRAEHYLEAAGFRVERIPTEDRAGATPIARRVASRVDRLVVVGGDGSVREAIEGLGEARNHVPIGIVPQGNANVVARELDIPRDVEGASRVAASGTARKMDLGLAKSDAGQTLFLAVVGIGWDASTVRSIDRVRHSAIGRLWYRTWADSVYVASGLVEAFRPRQSRFAVTVDSSGKDVSYCAAFLCNLRTYGKSMAVTPDAGPTTGRIHIQGRKRATPADLVWQLASASAGRRSPSFISDYDDGERIEVRAIGRDFPVEIDGDYWGRASRLDVTILPAGVGILTP